MESSFVFLFFTYCNTSIVILHRVYNPEKLENYIKDNPRAYLKEIANEFGGSVSGASAALKRMKIRLKKGL